MAGLHDIEVIGLGQACFDCLGRTPYFPEEDSKIELTDLHIQCGGPVASALTVLSRLGISTSFIGSISDDYFGIEILSSLRNESIDTTFLKITPGKTSQFAFISINKTNGNRNIFWKRSSAPFLRADNIDLNSFKNAKYLHLDGLMIEASIEAANQAKKMGIKVVVDAGTLREGFLDLLSLADVLITSEKFAKSFSEEDDLRPESVLKKLKELSDADTIIITRGAKGSTGLFKNNVVTQPAFKVDAVVDTTGAGDVYHGAYIYGLIMEWEMPTCMQFASAVSAIKCKQMGIINALPSLKNIKKYIDSYKF